MKLFAVAMRAEVHETVYVSAGYCLADDEDGACIKAEAMCKCEFPQTSGYRRHDYDLIEIGGEITAQLGDGNV